jgi:hypothetical protein
MNIISDLSNEFYTELMNLVETYLAKGLSLAEIEDNAYQAVEDMFGTDEYVDGE